MTKTNVEYVTTLTINNMVEKHMTVEDIAKKWNQGHTGPCRKGVNKHNQSYNSCQYVTELLDKYKRL